MFLACYSVGTPNQASPAAEPALSAKCYKMAVAPTALHAWPAGLLLGQTKPAAAAAKLQTMTSRVNLTDKWARVHLARLCAALVYAEWTSTQTFVSGVGAPMWKLLVLLATRCVSSAPHNRLPSAFRACQSACEICLVKLPVGRACRPGPCLVKLPFGCGLSRGGHWSYPAPSAQTCNSVLGWSRGDSLALCSASAWTCNSLFTYMHLHFMHSVCVVVCLNIPPCCTTVQVSTAPVTCVQSWRWSDTSGCDSHHARAFLGSRSVPSLGQQAIPAYMPPPI